MIKTKIAFNEAQKWVTTQTGVESDELSDDELLKLSTQLHEKAMKEAKLMTLRKFMTK